MGRTVLRQVAFYLDDRKVEALTDLKWSTGRTKQDLLREGLDYVLAKYSKKGKGLKSKK